MYVLGFNGFCKKKALKHGVNYCDTREYLPLDLAVTRRVGPAQSIDCN
jgi:hypothetical protein